MINHTMAANEATHYVEEFIAKAVPAQTYMTMDVSLGTVFAAKVAKECDRVHALVLLAPFGDFGEHMQL